MGWGPDRGPHGQKYRPVLPASGTTTPRHTSPRQAAQDHTTPHYTTLHYTTPHHTILSNHFPHYAARLEAARALTAARTPRNTPALPTIAPRLGP